MTQTSTFLNVTQLTSDVKMEADGLGFPLVGVCAAVTPSDALKRLQQWLASGYAGQMSYIPERLAAYADPSRVLDGARSVIMLAYPYRTAEPVAPQPGEGRIARYAWGEGDYHDVLHGKLKQLAAWLQERVPYAKVRGVVDSAPIMEREFAQFAGLGWIGKNTLLLNRTWGSYFFLAALLTDLELAYDDPFGVDHCGTCRACLDACPTDAFSSPYVLDATRCISYLTIELRDAIPESLRPRVGTWVFGCDICQDVCPWNRRTPELTSALWEPFEPRDNANPLALLPLFDLSDDDFRARFRHTPLWRSKRRGLLRNAAIVLGNQCCREALPVLRRAVECEEPLIGEACAWAVKQIERGETNPNA